MKKITVLIILFISFSTQAHNHPKNNKAEQKGWRLAIQAWSFNRFTLNQALDQIKQTGVKYLEMYPGQKIGGGIEGTTHFKMPKSTQKQLKNLLNRKGIRLVNYGVATCDNAKDWEILFQFAKAMGIETITSEPRFEDMKLVDQLANKYQVNLAIHNHPKDTRYWHPDIVLKSLKGCSQRIGACCDNGHWMRSSISPVDGYEQLKDHIISLHFKDMNAFGDPQAHTVPFGTGKHNIKQTLQKLDAINFKGVFTIEYEHNWKNPLPDIKQSVEYFYKVVNQIN